MGHNTALAFLGLGLALLTLDRPRAGEWPAQVLALGSGAIALVALTGYLYSATELYGIASFTQMALHTAAAMLVLAAGVLAGRPDRGLMATVTSDGPGGLMARRLLPAAVGVPLGVGWLRLEGQRAGLYDFEIGLSLMVTASVAIFATLTWFSAAGLNRADASRRQSEARTAATLAAALDGIVTIDHLGQITEFNPAAERTFGYRRSEVLGREMAALLIPPALRDRHRDGLARYLATGHGPVIGQRLELTALRADGTEFPVELTVIRLPSAGPPVFTGFLRDITREKQAQEALRESEASFRLLFASNPLPMWVYDVATMQFLEVNGAAVAHYGYSRDEFLRMRITEIRPPEEVARLVDAVTRRAAEPDEAIRRPPGVWKHRLKDGRIRDVEIVSHSLDFAGARAVLVVAIDVTELRQAQDALARSTERLNILHEIDRAVIAADAPVAIAEAVLRRLRDLLGVPRAIVNLFDFATGEVEWLAAVGRRRMHVGPGLRFPLALMGDVEALRRGERQVIDTASLPPSPETEALLASGVDVYMVVPMIAGGELIGGLSFGGPSRDFPPEQVSIAQEAATQLAIAIAHARLYERVKRQAEDLERRVETRTRELRAANEQLEREIDDRRRAEEAADRATRAKSQFLANMSHELRTPLNAIIGFTQLMHDGKCGPVSPRQQEFLGDVLASARHLLQLINDVLDVAKVESGTVEFHPEPVDLVRLVGEVRDVVQGIATSKRIRLETAVDPGIGPVVLDPARLRQILYNYVSNAVKFTPEAGRVSIRVAPDGPDGVRFDVEDTGIGIRPDDLGRLFVEFQQLDAGPGKRQQGTGLGLALTKRLVEAQGGHVGVRSTPGRGSVFTAVLPRTPGPVI
jgi:PAS domain S-box-containing protein